MAEFIRKQIILNRIKEAELIAVNAVAAEVAAEAIRLVPVDTGALKASIHATEAESTGSGVQAKVVAGIRYAKFVEFPTVRTAAQPFLRPALAQNRERLVREMASEVRKALGG